MDERPVHGYLTPLWGVFSTYDIITPMHSVDFFEVGKTIKRIRKDVDTQSERISYVHVKDKKTAEYHHSLQSDFIRYEKNEPRRSGYKGDKNYTYTPVIKVHRSGLDGTCTACESCYNTTNAQRLPRSECREY